MPHFGHLFRILSSCSVQAINNALAQQDMTAAQGHILGYLAHCGEPPCPRDLEEQFHLTHPTVSGLLSRMEKKGLLELRPDPNDRRCKRIHILPKGWELDDTIRSAIQANEARIVQGFSQEETALFADFLARAVQNLSGESCKSHFEEESNS